MAFAVADRVRETSTTTGVGALTLAGAVTGYQTFLAGWGASGTGWYAIIMGANWETGFGTLNAGGTTLTRTTVFASSNSGAAVNFGAGTKDVFGDIPADVLKFLNHTEITVTSAATCDIGAVHGAKILISGATGPITSLGTTANRIKFVRFDGAPTLTHNASSLILPTGANIVAGAGDTAIFVSDASGNWRCIMYSSPNAWAAFTPTVTSGTGTLTTASGAGVYKRVGKTVFVAVRATITTNGSGATDIRITVPVTERGGTPGQYLVGKEIATTGKMCMGNIVSGLIICNYYDGTYPGGTGAIIEVSGCYEGV